MQPPREVRTRHDVDQELPEVAAAFDERLLRLLDELVDDCCGQPLFLVEDAVDLPPMVVPVLMRELDTFLSSQSTSA